MHDVQFQYAITNRVRTRRTLESFATECPTELQKYTQQCVHYAYAEISNIHTHPNWKQFNHSI